jgi:hypothetical protein
MLTTATAPKNAISGALQGSYDPGLAEAQAVSFYKSAYTLSVSEANSATNQNL